MKEIATGDTVTPMMAHCFGPNYPAINDIHVRYFNRMSNDVGIHTAEHFTHGPYGKIVLVVDENDTSTTKDDVVSRIGYVSRGDNQSALVGTVVVEDRYNNVFRSRRANYDDVGNMDTLVIYNDSQNVTYAYRYDSYGNIIERHVGDMQYNYGYDSLLNLFNTSVVDSSLHLRSHTDYDVRLGVPTRIYSVTGDSISYSYDNWGRLIAVRLPFEHDTSLYPTVCFYYWDNVNSTPALCSGPIPILTGHVVWPGHRQTIVAPLGEKLWTQTHRHTAADTAEDVVSYIFTDGFGRLAQSRERTVVDGLLRQVASGLTKYDNMGRIVVRHDPFVVGDPFHNEYVSPQGTDGFVQMEYDVLDRVVNTTVHTHLSNLVTTVDYGFGHAGEYCTMRKTITDPEGNVTTKYTDARGLDIMVTDAMDGVTRYEYDIMSQLCRSVDPEGFESVYGYDKIGHMTYRHHPDAGETKWAYNDVGQMIRQINADGTYINYSYHGSQMTSTKYSRFSANDVRYTYGTSSNEAGRVMKIESGTVVEEIRYDDMGNISKRNRIFALPNSNVVYSFAMLFEYDSWNRMRSMTYPDGEEVIYGYDGGGRLNYMGGSKYGARYGYIDSLHYNEYGGRTGVWYANGTKTEYHYDGFHRMDSLVSYDAVGNKMQDIGYVYDGVGNIKGIRNTAGVIDALGGVYSNVYTYDSIGRLTESVNGYREEGVIQKMGYSPSGRIKNRFVDNRYGDKYYAYCDKYQPHVVRRIYDKLGGELEDLQWYVNGTLAQVNVYQGMEYQNSRWLFWTEDDRLHSVVDDRSYSYYGYDAAGERVFKLTGRRE